MTFANLLLILLGPWLVVGGLLTVVQVSFPELWSVLFPARRPRPRPVTRPRPARWAVA